MSSGIYKIVNVITGKCYVGSAVNINKRFIKHKTELKYNKHHSPKLQNSYNKHGADNFVYEIIEECDKDKLIEREQNYIDLYDSYNNGYNSKPKADSFLGGSMSDEAKAKISIANKGKRPRLGHTNSKDHRDKISHSRKGHIVSKETRKK